MKVLVSIVNWMNYWDTIACIDQCKQQEYRDIEIVVVDNASVNESILKISEAHRDITIIKSRSNKGFAAGHKMAYEYAKKHSFDVIWLLNPDVEIYSDTLSTIIDAYKIHGLAIYGSITIDNDGNNKSLCNQSNGIKGFEITILPNTNADVYQTDFVSGSSFFIPMEVTDKIGFMSTCYFMYVEEVDYSFKAYKNGILSYYVLHSKIKHEGAKSFEVSPGLQYIKTYYKVRNYIYFTLKTRKYSRRVIRINHGGFRAMLRNALQRKNLELHYNAMGVLHAYFGITGRVLNPNDFLKLKE